MNTTPRPRRPRITTPCGLFGRHIESPKIRAQYLVASTDARMVQLIVELHKLASQS